MKTEVERTTRKGKSILLFFPLILNYSVRSIYYHTNSYNNAITQCHVDGAQRAWATCASSEKQTPKFPGRTAQVIPFKLISLVSWFAPLSLIILVNSWVALDVIIF